MSVEAKRKQREPLNVFLRRFSEQVKRSGVINQHKKNKFYIKKKSQTLKKESALQRRKRAEKMTFLKKVGRIK